MFKLLAFQVLKDCEEYIRRCLKPDMIYYLCNDYDISGSNKNWIISKTNGGDRGLDESFFKVSQNSNLNLNISAIVGENGSGKSTIVELIMRIINNCAIRYNLMAEGGQLRYVDGVHARLFYKKGDSIYCICIAGPQDSISVCEIARLEKGEITGCNRVLSAENIKEHFFYTLVSNYSHYAYNTYDFRKEWGKQSEEDTCWLKWLFHKNDGYQAPITLHPFRDKGTIDIEREKNLSNQRLLHFFINYAKQNTNEGVFKYINDKKPKYLNLNKVTESKLQKTTLLDFFRENRDVNLIGEEILFLEKIQSNDHSITDDELLQFNIMITNPLEELSDWLEINKIGTKTHGEFFNTMLEWLERTNEQIDNPQDKILSEDSDLKRLLNTLEQALYKIENFSDVYKSVQNSLLKLKLFVHLNVCQLQRLVILNLICELWSNIKQENNDLSFEISPSTIIEDVDNLSLEQLCYHYIIYKTIDIFETYPSFHYPLWTIRNYKLRFAYHVSLNLVVDAFNQLIEDITLEKTHITLKLRQSFFYLNHSLKDGKGDYSNYGNIIKGIDGFCLSFGELNEYYEKEATLEMLPPPIYERHLLFEAEKGILVDMDTFSSGEKQLLNTQSAIIYHMQNLSSIFKDPDRTTYPQVNIILEEIELYFHPEYQRCFIKSLISLLESSNISENIRDVNILIVTHSPFILSDIPKNNVLFLKDGKQYIEMQENTFGANIHTMLQNAFFLNGVTIGDFARSKINLLFGKLHNDEITDELYREILLVSEPFIKSQLLKLYNERFPHHMMEKMADRIERLEGLLDSGKND